MKRIIVLLTIILLTATGCWSGNSNPANNASPTNTPQQSVSLGLSSDYVDSDQSQHWDHREGFVIAKQDGEVLIVRDEVSDINAPLDKLLQAAKPNAMWLGVDEANYDSVTMGDHVVIDIPSGVIDQSYPEQASGRLFLKSLGFNGYVVNAKDNRILVVSSVAQDFSANGGQKNYYEAIWFTKPPSHIEVGMNVAVWSNGMLLESYPAQGTANYVRAIINPEFKKANLTEQEAVRQAIASLNNDDESELVVIKDVQYDVSTAEWTVHLLNKTRDQVEIVTIADQ